MRKLGIIAGSGGLPGQIASAHDRRGGGVFMIAFEGITSPDVLDGRDHAWFRLGRVQAVLDSLHAAAVEDVVMAGPVPRPSMSSLGFDGRAAKILFRAGRRAFGDDGLLSAIASELEGEGFRVVGVETVVDGILAPLGCIAGPELDDIALTDIERGVLVLERLAPVDVGQSVAVQEGLVLAVEAIEGTNGMIARAGTLKRSGPCPVLVKMAKADQERRIDLPTIGPDTVRSAAAAGFRGIAVQAGASLLIDGDEVRRVAAEAGIAVVGIDVHGQV